MHLSGSKSKWQPCTAGGNIRIFHSLFVHLQLQLLCSAIFSLCKFFNAPSFTSLINSVYNDCIIIILCWFKGQGKKGVCVSKGCAVAHEYTFTRSVLILDVFLTHTTPQLMLC